MFAVEPVSPRDVRSFLVKSIPMRPVELEAGTSALTRLDRSILRPMVGSKVPAHELGQEWREERPSELTLSTLLP